MFYIELNPKVDLFIYVPLMHYTQNNIILQEYKRNHFITDSCYLKKVYYNDT